MVSLEVGIKIFLKKPLQDQEGMEVFPKTKKVHLEIYNIHRISFFFFFLITAIAETAMKTVLLLVRYLFNNGRLDLILKMCLISHTKRSF